MTTLTITDFKEQYLETRNEQRKGYGSNFVLPSLKKQEHFIHDVMVSGFDSEVIYEFEPHKRDLKQVRIIEPSKKPVYLFDKHGNYLKTFESITQCAKYLGVCSGALSNHFKKPQSFVMDHTVKYATNLKYSTPDKPNLDQLF